MRRLHNRIRPYAWGSREVIARVQGRPVPSEGPEAELWVGAHPDCSSLVDGEPLADVIASAPGDLLGAEALGRFGARLPYLLKLLAAERSLSLQAHPDARQAADGYAAEDAAGVPRDAAHRSYVDGNHKPELLVAYTEFEALCGFRPAEESAELLDALGVMALKPVVGALAVGDLREAVRALLSWPAHTRADLVEEAVAASGELPDGPAGGGPRGGGAVRGGGRTIRGRGGGPGPLDGFSESHARSRRISADGGRRRGHRSPGGPSPRGRGRRP